MKTEAFSVYDEKSKAFGVPFFAVNSGVATRMFTDLVNDPKSTPFRYPTDFSLYHVGEFDDFLGALVPLPSPVPLGKASQFKSASLTEVK